MFLGFAKNEVADEVAGIVGRNHAALFGASSSVARRLCVFLYSSCLVQLVDCFPVCRFAVNKPVGSRFGKVIATHCPILVHDGRLRDETIFQERMTTLRIFHNQPQPSILCGCQHHADNLIKLLAVAATFKDSISGELCSLVRVCTPCM